MNLSERLSATAARLPHKDAVLFEGRTLAYGELDARVARAAAGLRRLGLRPGADGEPGDRVALLAGNSPTFVEACHAVLRAGLVAVPLNEAFTAEEAGTVLADSGAKAVVVDRACLDVLEPARGDAGDLQRARAAGDLEHVVVADGEPIGGAPTWQALAASGEPAEPAAVDDDALALLQYTSGTTGRPKGAMLSHGNLLANHEQMLQTPLRVEERDIVLSVLPLSHIYGLNVVMAFCLARGASLLLETRFDPVGTLRRIEAARATVIVGAPPMYGAWVGTEDLERYDLNSVRYAVSGAAPLPAETLLAFRERTGVDVWEGYGLTETAPVLTSTAVGGRPKPGSVGRPLPGVELRLVDDAGLPVRQGDPGEVVVRGPNVFSGYWRRPEETAEVLDADGWFRTADVAYADDDGDLHLVDRKNDLIIVSGFNVYPREVEDVLARHPKVAAAAVVGVPDARTGEKVRAIVALVSGQEATGSELVEFCRRSLARFKVPEAIELVDELPVLPSGKVLRRRLRGA